MSDHRPLGVQISRMLKDRGVDVIFGIPGVHNQELYRGIEQAGITHVLARHEQGAGFMADGYARASGRPGVSYVITGPGLCNIMTPIGQGYSDSVPMLVISSCLDETSARRGQLHQMKDQRLAGDTVADWSEEARTADAAYSLIDRALTEFQTARPRPKHIQVPISVLEADAPAAGPGQPTPAMASGVAPLQEVAQALTAAPKPLFIFGGGLASNTRPSAQDLVQDVLKRTGAASFTTYAGRGLVAPDTPLLFGSYLARPSSADSITQADCVVAIGTSLDEVDIWRKDLGHSVPLIRVDIDPEVLSDHQTTDQALAMGGQDFLRGLLEHLPVTGSSAWDASTIATQRSQWRAEVDAEFPSVLPVVEALRACLPEDAMIFSDMTQFAYASKEVWDMPCPGHWHHPFGFGTLGYALPAAIGGAIARPDQPTLAIAGDYGFQYTCNELGTAVELGLSLPILLWDNGKLGAIESSMVAAQIAPNAVIQQNPDFGLLAQAYGAHYTQPATMSVLQEAVLAALSADKPTLIRMTPALSG